MKPYEIVASKRVQANAKVVYDILKDYRNGHPNILPKRYFINLEVERGGVGAGTRIRFQMKTMGTVRTFVADITEPEPGRVLTEKDAHSGVVTQFIVEPRGEESHVTIRTDLESHGGILGVVERVTTKRFLTRIYEEELRLLSEVAGTQRL
jgi:hypothetical protein